MVVRLLQDVHTKCSFAAGSVIRNTRLIAAMRMRGVSLREINDDRCSSKKGAASQSAR
jgi:hypothetical protein